MKQDRKQSTVYIPVKEQGEALWQEQDKKGAG